MEEKKTILIADDDSRNIFALKAVLSAKGMKCITATDGNLCIRMLEDSSDVGIVLLDMMMPVMDGYQTLQVLRKNPKYIDLPIIAVTAQAMTGDKEKCIQAGATDYIAKPIEVERLMEILKKYL